MLNIPTFQKAKNIQRANILTNNEANYKIMDARVKNIFMIF